jgi:hypothetical protein
MRWQVALGSVKGYEQVRVQTRLACSPLYDIRVFDCSLALSRGGYC